MHQADMMAIAISIHAPPRGATGAWRLLGVLESHFNSRPSARGDPPRNPLAAQQPFQFTPLREGRRHLDTRAVCLRLNISIHAPPRGATRRARGTQVAEIFQFTPLREGRPDFLTPPPPHPSISIHAPPRGATSQIFVQQTRQTISIHAPPRGATRGCSTRLTRSSTFQFTPLREGRHKAAVPAVPARFISIHAPPRGATPYVFPLLVAPTLFQFTPLREGRRTSNRICYKLCQISIHAPPRGATVYFTRFSMSGGYFNSRPSARGDAPLAGF